MTNQIEIHDYEYDFYCPMCGTKVIDMNPIQPKTHACKHLRYVSTSEAPGMPEYIAESLAGMDLSCTHECANVEAVDKAIKGPTMRFMLGGGDGYIDLYAIFEVLYEDS
jgi:hypothetical protein